jgi:AcrR family transcriptional regulator
VLRPNTRADILAAALDLFTSQGYEATSLREIADRLGITKAALYYHFPAKEWLVVELTGPWLDGLEELVRPDASADDADSQRPEARIVAYVDLCIRHHAVLRLLSNDVTAQQHPDVGQRARTLVAALHDTLSQEDGSETARIRVACAVGAVHSVATLDPGVLPMARSVVAEAAIAALRGEVRGRTRQPEVG